MPTALCKGCVRLLEASYKLSSISTKAQVKLRSLFQDSQDVSHTPYGADVQVSLNQKEETKEVLRGENYKDCDTEHNEGTYLTLDSKRKTSMVNPIAPSVCDLCNVAFNNIEEFDEHIDKQHHELYSASDSVNNMANSITLKQQTEDQPSSDSHPDSPDPLQMSGLKKFACDVCGRRFNRHYNMRKHMKRHKPTHLWEHHCKSCSESFEHLRDLMIHMENEGHIETTVKPNDEEKSSKPHGWYCRFCSKALTSLPSLMSHESIHTDARPYVCEICGTRFRRNSNLQQHLVSHTGHKSHECPVCKKMFGRPAHLQQHMRVHTKEKPFVCDRCGAGFSQAGDMRRHCKRHESKDEKENEKDSDGVKVRENTQNCHLQNSQRDKSQMSPMSKSKTKILDCEDPKSHTSNVTHNDESILGTNDPLENKRKRESLLAALADSCTKSERAKETLPMDLGPSASGSILKQVRRTAGLVSEAPVVAQIQAQPDPFAWFMCNICCQHYPQAMDLQAHKIECHGICEDAVNSY